MGKHSKGIRSLDAPINLVPFIDLLSVCICFLIMTAVWVQISQIEINLPKANEGSGAGSDAPPPFSLTVVVKKESFGIVASGGSLPEIPKKPDGKYDTVKLAESLKTIHENFPNEHEIIIASDPTIGYEKLIDTMDVAVKNGFDAISLAPWNDTAAPQQPAP